MKGAAPFCFRRALLYSYFEKDLLIYFLSTSNNLLKHYISVEVLLMKAYAQGTVWKELLIAPFLDHFWATTLGKPQW